ncbi:uncharacterized protein A4U43_C08F2610 [Asparagus officinalis]|nr:uncharacterized protein A4U43_C08F2610 [Asparagus officinalis]
MPLHGLQQLPCSSIPLEERHHLPTVPPPAAPAASPPALLARFLPPSAAPSSVRASMRRRSDSVPDLNDAGGIRRELRAESRSGQAARSAPAGRAVGVPVRPIIGCCGGASRASPARPRFAGNCRATSLSSDARGSSEAAQFVEIGGGGGRRAGVDRRAPRSGRHMERVTALGVQLRGAWCCGEDGGARQEEEESERGTSSCIAAEFAWREPAKLSKGRRGGGSGNGVEDKEQYCGKGREAGGEGDMGDTGWQRKEEEKRAG